jgi:C4-type Zn-finger protein
MNPILGVNPDGYSFIIRCPVCKEKRSVTVSRIQVAGDGEVTVSCIFCDHTWAITPEEKEKLRKMISFGASA